MADDAPTTAVIDRRPIRARGSGWARVTSTWLARRRVSPNFISMSSVGCAVLAFGGFAMTHWSPVVGWQLVGLVVAIIGMQGRLVCNLLDGMVAVEGKLGGPLGDIYNDLPDRLADPIILMGAGLLADPYYSSAVTLAAVTGSLLTAYVRVLGRAIGAGSHFVGPMAKQHRMAVLTLACVVGCLLIRSDFLPKLFTVALTIIAIGCVVTFLRRLLLIRRDLLGR